ncbi:NAD(P)/FAD-dependent oxidoreductase [Roseibacillus ishigakijimensis]|uniref:NADH:ubiquinone reductase (non-electrogenic) n=1 Tax=Roseibacillus ishigakijimensis TaxID=454146 RepID=A0A934RPN0_9BACT|nr:NAD(P)/FAD-dependent oxidoreductase [Roseibacillus ishigakijimensis]MBK1834653.1 NAD(P)/FAD-dependent oxidoreductase [Roseibacillus ishigakijimensis]
MPEPRKVLIIGGGFAGLACARTLADDPRFHVTLIDRENHHLFQPLLYQVATTSLAAPDIARSLRGILTKAANVKVLLDHIERVDGEKKIAYSERQDYPFDYLVLACGARTSYFGRDEWAECTIGLKNLSDAHRIRARALSALERAEITTDEAERRRLMTIVLVGGGPTGVELAGAFSDLVRRAMHSDFRNINPAELKILLVQSGDRLLKPFEPELSEYARQRLQALGVEVILGPRVDQIEPGRAHLNQPCPSPLVADDGWVEAETIIWAAGVQAHDLTRHVGVETDRAGRIAVNPDLSLPGHPDLFAAGDIVDLTDHNGVKVPGLAPAANQMGKHIAKLLKEEARLETTSHADRKHSLRPRFAYRDKGQMAIIGKNTAVMQTKNFRGKGFFAWISWLLIHVAFLVGFRSKLFVMMQWSYAYLFNKPGARVFVNRPGHD